MVTANSHICLLGTFPDLAWQELQAISPCPPQKIAARLALIEGQCNPQQLLERSGGIVKIWQVIDQLPSQATNEQIESKLAELLRQEKQTKLEFGLAEWGRDQKTRLDAVSIKHLLKQIGFKSRFREGPRTGLSAALLLHRPIVELAVIETENQTWLAKAVAWQNIDEWSSRDRNRPFAERRRGLLPVKVARMMVNLCLPELQPNALVFDPFCGGGTILMEAHSLGYQIAGSDLDPTAVAGTRENLRWLESGDSRLDNSPSKTDLSMVLLGDATTIQLDFTPDAVVTEPFLGKPKPTLSEVKNVSKGLVKMYLGFLKNMRNQLPAGTPLIVVFPQFTGQKTISTYSLLIDKLDAIGYTTVSGPLLYARPGAVVERQIVKLKVK